MAKEVEKDNKIVYQCKVCGFHYRDKETAERCHEWCKKHKSCNLGIIKNAEDIKKPI